MASTDTNSPPAEVDAEKCCGWAEDTAPCGEVKCPGILKLKLGLHIGLSFGVVITGSILMIVGGKRLQDGSWQSFDKGYAMSLNPSVDVPSCLQGRDSMAKKLCDTCCIFSFTRTWETNIEKSSTH